MNSKNLEKVDLKGVITSYARQILIFVLYLHLEIDWPNIRKEPCREDGYVMRRNVEYQNPELWGRHRKDCRFLPKQQEQFERTVDITGMIKTYICQKALCENCNCAKSKSECLPLCGCQRKCENTSWKHISEFDGASVSRAPAASTVKLSLTSINGFQPLTVVTKNPIFDVTGLRDT